MKKIVPTLKSIWYFFHVYRIKFGITPFVMIGEHKPGINLLRARVGTPLARRGQCIAVPNDKMIHSYVLNYGQWGKDEARFLAKLIKPVLKEESNRCLLIDFGAHAGLVTKQVLDNLENPNAYAILVDPLGMNIEAQEFNLSRHRISTTHVKYAISNISGRSNFLMDTNNVGSSHIKGNSTLTSSEVQYEIKSMTPKEFEELYLQKDERIAIKSDIEGWDAFVLGSLGPTTWKKIIGGVIEVEGNLDSIAPHALNLKKELSEFKLSWDPLNQHEVSILALFDYWTSSGEEVRNLYFYRA